MTEEEFVKIYESGSKEEVKGAIVEMNKKFTLMDMSRMLKIMPGTFRNITNKLGVVANPNYRRRNDLKIGKNDLKKKAKKRGDR